MAHLVRADSLGPLVDNRPRMDLPALDNRTDFAAHPQMLLDRDGEKLAVIVKATYEVHEDGSVDVAPSDRARPVRFADLPWEKDRPESIAYPADVCLRKPGTDVVLVAKAHAPGGRAVPSFDARVEVGPLSRSIVVFGRRLWRDRGAGLTEPAPVDAVEVRYDLAWGGRDDSDPRALVEEPRNPVGRGVARDPAELTHALAPQIEDPAELIASSRTQPKPVGLGPIGRSWEPRRRYAGTYDKAWQEERAPLLPADFDDRFNLCASPGLWATSPLAGGEPVRLLNLVPGGGLLSFSLPKVALEIEIRIEGREPAIFRPHLDTVLVDLLLGPPDTPAVVELVWRAHVKAPRKMRDARVVVRERSAS
jgi:hypothetical protein